MIPDTTDRILNQLFPFLDGYAAALVLVLEGKNAEAVQLLGRFQQNAEVLKKVVRQNNEFRDRRRKRQSR